MAQSWPPLLDRTPGRPLRPISVDEWLQLPKGEQGEVVDGFLVEEEVPDAVHELAVTWLIQLMRVWLGGVGFVFGSDLKMLTRENRGRRADLAVYLPGSPAPPKRGAIRRPPDILVEVVIPSPRDERRDRVEKMEEYASFGVSYYWLVDPALGSFEIFERNSAGTYTRVVGVTEGRIDRVPACQGLAIDVDALWAELARLADE